MSCSFFVSLVVLLVRMFTRRARQWILGIIACFGIAMFVTPADPLSMLVVALPYSVAFVVFAMNDLLLP